MFASKLKRLAIAALLSCAGILAAHAQTVSTAGLPAAGLPQNITDRPLPLTSADPSGLVMRKAVLLMRHGVRPPTSTSKFQAYAALPFPSNGATGWNEPDGDLTPYGATLVQGFGTIERSLYAAKGLISATGCPGSNDVFVWGDNADERTQATAVSLLAGLYSGCTVTSTPYSTSATADPIFSSPFTLSNTTTATAAVMARMGGSFAPLQSATAALMTQMNTVLGCCSTTICTQNSLPAGCTFGQLPWSITVSSGTLAFNGPLATGSSIAQIFELEYENGFTGSNFGFGKLTEAQMQTLEQFYTLKYGFFDRAPVLAQLNGSTLAQQMLDAVLQAPGETTAGPPNAKLTVFVGHDSTQAALGGMLNLHWGLATSYPDDMPAGNTVGFEVLSDAAEQNWYVRPVWIGMTIDAMHAGVPKATLTPPTYEALQLPGCSLDLGRLCTLSDFVTLMQAAINPAQVATPTYR